MIGEEIAKGQKAYPLASVSNGVIYSPISYDNEQKTESGRDWGLEETGMTDDEMAGCNHRLNRREFE